ncbi:MAG: hypothetical protein IKR40_04345 [Treponema sp.]|nr:hypothetical protein [Treponema sp.]
MSETEEPKKEKKGSRRKKIVLIIIAIPVLLILWNLGLSGYRASVNRKVEMLYESGNYIEAAKVISKGDTGIKILSFGVIKHCRGSGYYSALIFALAAPEDPSYIAKIETLVAEAEKKKNGFEASSDLALLVVCYAQGRGVAQDMQKAKELYNRAIAACDNCYLHGPYGVLDDSLVKEQKEHVYGILAEFGIDTTVFAE